LSDPVQRAVGEAIAGIDDGKRERPRRRLEEALRLDPRNQEARAAMLRLSVGAIAGGANPEQIVSPPLSDEERALADGWATRARDPRRASSRAFAYRARDLARATAADDPELSWMRAAVLRRLGVTVARGAPRNPGAGKR